MRMPQLLHKPIPLDAPKHEGEIEYTNLELSRLRRSAINFQRIVIASLAFFLVASTLLIAINVTNEHTKAHDQCVSSNHGRAEIKQAFADLYDGFIKASGNSQAAVDFKNQRMAQLERGLPQRQC